MIFFKGSSAINSFTEPPRTIRPFSRAQPHNLTHRCNTVPSCTRTPHFVAPPFFSLGDGITPSSPAPPPAPAGTAQVSGVGCSVGLCHRCSLLATNSKLIKLKAQKVTWVRTNQKQHNLEVDSLRCRLTLPLWFKVRKKLRFLAYDEQLRWMYDVKLTSTSALTAGTEKACS